MPQAHCRILDRTPCSHTLSSTTSTHLERHLVHFTMPERMAPASPTSLIALLLTLASTTTAQCFTATRFLPETTCPPPSKGGADVTDPKGSPKGKGCAFKCPLPTFSTVTIPPAIPECPETTTVTSYETGCGGACPTDVAGCPKSLLVTVTATTTR